jgi:uncharacterized membrane protein YfhO
MEYDVTVDTDALVVFSEVWYPVGWVARVDGEIVEPIRVNYLFRALRVPPGKHKVTWVYETTASNGTLISFVNGILLLFIGAGFWMGLKKKESIRIVD